jgi:hypothetical protein
MLRKSAKGTAVYRPLRASRLQRLLLVADSPCPAVRALRWHSNDSTVTREPSARDRGRRLQDSAYIELVISSSVQEAPPFLCIKDQIRTGCILGTSYVHFIVRYCNFNACFDSAISAPAPIKSRGYDSIPFFKIHLPPDTLEISSNDCLSVIDTSSRHLKIFAYTLTPLSSSK